MSAERRASTHHAHSNRGNLARVSLAPNRPRLPRYGASLATVGVLAILILVLPTSSFGAIVGVRASPGTTTSSGNTVGLPGVLHHGSIIATTASSFWSVDAQTGCARCIATDPAVRTFLNATPFDWVRYGTGLDSCNVSTNMFYPVPGPAVHGCGYNITALKDWCGTQVPRCHAILGLPGENNNSAEDAAIAKWIVHTVGFQPAYWEIGNEPTGWTHYGIPWTRWAPTDHSGATALAYAFDVRAAIRAVSAVDPGAKFIGVEAACSCNPSFFTDVGKIDGGVIAAIGYHSYPSGGTHTESLRQFYSPLASVSNVSASYSAVRSALVAGCPGCRSLPIFINEYNAGPGAAPSSLGGSFANAVFLAASVTEALRTNVTQWTVFNLQTTSTHSYGYSLLNGTDRPGPTGVLFTHLLRGLVLGQVYSSHVATSVGGIYDVVTQNRSTGTILVASTNLTQSLALSLGPWFGTTTFASALYWAPGMAAPRAIVPGAGGSFVLGPQAILLVTFHLTGGGPPPITGTPPVPFNAGTPGVLLGAVRFPIGRP